MDPPCLSDTTYSAQRLPSVSSMLKDAVPYHLPGQHAPEAIHSHVFLLSELNGIGVNGSISKQLVIFLLYIKRGNSYCYKNDYAIHLKEYIKRRKRGIEIC